ncbi:MAG: nucleotide exchange factor GrpE [Candidatus Dormibacteria bacterium]
MSGEPKPPAGELEPSLRGEPEASSPGPDRVAELEAELTQLTASYQRLAADFENFRRRKGQESAELVRYGSAALLEALLPALDNLQRAVAHIPVEEASGLTEGLRLTVKQLEEGLASQGVLRIAAEGQPFDPRLHHAVLTVPAGEVEPGTVVAELVPGYTLHDRVVRPAQVTVAEGSADPVPHRASRSRSARSPGPAVDSSEASPN